MSTTIANSFVTEYAEMVHQSYQQRGSKMRNTVRLQTGVEGSRCVFQKVGKGAAGKKTRHGNVPLMNLNHSTVSCTLSDWYAAEYVDKLDEMKDKQDEKKVAAEAGAWALGRKIDELLISKLSGASNMVAEASSGLTKDKILQAFGTLNASDVADDGHRFAVVGPHQWNELLNIQEFKSSDYAGDDYAWLKGTESRTWLGITWCSTPACLSIPAPAPASSTTATPWVWPKARRSRRSWTGYPKRPPTWWTTCSARARASSTPRASSKSSATTTR